MADINKLRTHFESLSIGGKREFVKNLESQIAGVSNSRYKPFLLECKKALELAKKNETTRKANEATALSNELFAKAIASMLSGHEPASKKPNLTGRWVRDTAEKSYYIEYNADGSFETNDFVADNRKIFSGQTLRGFYSVGEDGQVYMEPHETLSIAALMITNNNKYMIITRTNGSTIEYRKVV